MSETPFIRIPVFKYFPPHFKLPEVMLYSWLLNRAKLNGHKTLLVFCSVRDLSAAIRTSVNRTYNALEALEAEKFIRLKVSKEGIGKKGGRLMIAVLKDPFEKKKPQNPFRKNKGR